MALTDAQKFLKELLGEVENRLSARIDKVSKQLDKTRIEIKREFNRVHKDQNLIIKHFNEEVLGLRGKVGTLEQKAHIHQIS